MNALRSQRNTAILGLLVVTTLLWAIGCGREQAPAPAEAGSLYSLDPPELGLTSAPGFADGVPVLCYHYFRSGIDPAYLLKVLGSVLFGMPALGPREFWTTPAGEFEKHLQYFRDSGTQVMTLDEVAATVAAGRTLPRRAVVLTIDDADESVYRLAWPLLREYGMRAHLFVPTGQVGRKWGDLKVCTWEQLREMSESGQMVMGSHTRDMHYKLKTPRGMEPVFWNPAGMPAEAYRRSLGALARRQRHDGVRLDAAQEAALAGRWAPVAADLLVSRLDLRGELGTDARWLAWPYGFASGSLDSLSRQLGFVGTVSLAPRAFTAHDTLLAPGRFTLTAKTTLQMIKDVTAPR